MMNSLMSQIVTVVSMNVRSLPARGWMAGATLLAVATVVTVFLAFMSMSDGFKNTMSNSGSTDLGIALRAASRSELNSGLGSAQVKLLEDAPGIYHDAKGPLVSAELYVIVDGIKKSTGTAANLSLRGVGDNGLRIRPNLKIIKGRMFEAGKNELIAGKSVVDSYKGFEVGDEVAFGTTKWKVVGEFSGNGSVYDSELWTDTRAVQTQFNRGNSYQSIRFKLETPGDVSKIEDYIKGNPQLNLDINTEKQYFTEQSDAVNSLKFMVVMGWILSVMMALGSLSGALNAMYNSVSQRTREIATLRALGFNGTSAFFGTMVESLVLSICGGILGTLLAYLLFDGMSGSTLGGSFTQVAFQFKITSDSFVKGIEFAIVIGLVGGFFPALKASRIPVLKAFTLESN